MDREILFRGKSEVNSDWVYGYYCPKPFSHFPCEPAIYPIDTINKCYAAVKINIDTLGQYIELNDCNRKKIFEGDIVRDNSDNSLYKIEYKFNNWNNFVFTDIEYGSIYELYEFRLKDFEVVGNIYDNPELLDFKEV